MKLLIDLFFTFFKISLFTFGGGYAMIPLIKETIIEKKKWLTEDELLEIIAISESTPGPIAINMATYIGYRQKKIWGSIIATIGVVLPSFIIIYIISLFINKFLENKYVAYAFSGINCAVGILIISASVNMFIKQKKTLIPLLMIISTITAMICIELFNLNFSSIYLILIGGLIGLLVNGIKDAKEKKINKEETVETKDEEETK